MVELSEKNEAKDGGNIAAVIGSLPAESVRQRKTPMTQFVSKNRKRNANARYGAETGRISGAILLGLHWTKA